MDSTDTLNAGLASLGVSVRNGKLFEGADVLYPLWCSLSTLEMIAMCHGADHDDLVAGMIAACARVISQRNGEESS